MTMHRTESNESRHAGRRTGAAATLVFGASLCVACGSDPAIDENHSGSATAPEPVSAAQQSILSPGWIAALSASPSTAADDQFTTDLLSFMGDMKSIFGDISTVVGAINTAEVVLRYLGLLDPATDEVAVLLQDVNQVATGLSFQSQNNFDNMAYGPIISTVETLADHPERVTPGPGYDMGSQDAVNWLLSSSGWTRAITGTNDPATDGPTLVAPGGSFYGYFNWKGVISRRPAVTDGLVFDWRLGAPLTLHAITARLLVMGHLNPNFLFDHSYDTEISTILNGLTGYYQAMSNGLTCAMKEYVYAGVFDGGWHATSDACALVCADINTGLASISSFTPSSASDTSTLGTACSSVQNSLSGQYFSTWNSTVQQVRGQMPFFEIRSMMDILYRILNPSADLTDVAQRIPSVAGPGLCIDTDQGASGDGTNLVLQPCAPGTPSQYWNYDRITGQIVNPFLGKCIDERWSVSFGQPIGIWDCDVPHASANGGPADEINNLAQKWTYDSQSHKLRNALGTVMEAGSTVAGSLVYTDVYGETGFATISRAWDVGPQWVADQPGCADGTVEQSFPNGAVGCAGAVTFDSRNSLCANGGRVCSSAEWAAMDGSVEPTHDYWTDDVLMYSGGGSGDCSVSTSTGYACSDDQPMRVCTSAGTDPEGNQCNWTGCGIDGSTAGLYFGGCDGNTTAGALCCP
jgi:Ricin-type beta-trefoil lectin domain